MKKNIFLTMILCGTCASASAICTYMYNKEKIEFADEYAVFRECVDFLESENYEIKNKTELMNGVISGYMKSAGDDYGYYHYMSEEDNYLQMVNFSAPMMSTGFQVYNDGNGRLEIVNVFVDSPAEEQGLKVGDIITEINGNDVKSTGIMNIAEKLMGKDGTTMTLTIEREGKTEKLDIVRSNNISSSSVEGKMIDDVGYLKISSFTLNSDVDFGGALENISADCGKYIIDLRQNEGGTTDSAVSIASRFTSEGNVIQYHNDGEKTIFPFQSVNRILNGKFVVLTDEDTASGAEILTAAIKQYCDDVTIVGENTFGKGIFQLEHTLSNGGILHYTAGYYTVGEWECYDGVGIAPDIEVEMDKSLIGTDGDIQLEKAVEVLTAD